MLELRAVSRTYRRPPQASVVAVDNVTLSVAMGETLGIAGPNGAGKSTLIAMILGFVRPTSGVITIAGCDPRTYIKEQGIGYLPELPVINREWKVGETLTRFGHLEGLGKTRARELVQDALTKLGLLPHEAKLARELSKGTLQRLGIAQCVLVDHDLVIFDEPTHGLDPVWTHRFRELVESLRDPRRTILIASHNLDELQRLSDRVAIMGEGKLQRVVNLKGDTGVQSASFKIVLASGEATLPSVFPSALRVGEREFIVSSLDVERLNSGIVDLISKGARILSVAAQETLLEQQFREVVPND